MPKNKGKGGKKFRRGKHANETKRPLVLKNEEEDQCYGQVMKILGNGRFEVNCYEKDDNDNFIMKSRLCIIRGSMRKKVWIKMSDIVLVSLRSFQDDRADIMYKYEDYEVSDLLKINHIPNISDINNDNLLFENSGDDTTSFNKNTSYNDIYNSIDNTNIEEESEEDNNSE